MSETAVIENTEVTTTTEVNEPVNKATTDAAPVADKTVAEKPVAEKAAEPDSWIPPDWRERMAGALPETATPEEKTEHGKLINRLKRLNSPSDLAKAIREQDKLISSGQLKKALPKDAKPEQVAEWRKENGIPEAPDKYDLGVPKDIELNELDNQMLAGWAAKAHATNATPEQVKAGVAAYFETRAAIAAQMEESNTAAKSETTEALRAEWGPDYKSNVDGVLSWMNSQDSAATEALLSARTADGVQLLNRPEVMRMLAAHARELGYVGATVVPNGADLGASIDTELADLRSQMGTPAWEKNAKGQARFLQLTEAKNRIGARNG